MKKILKYLFTITLIIALSACSMGNTPTKKVENFLDKYKNNDTNVMSQLKEMINSDNLMDDTQKDTYSGIIKKQYSDLTYEIKNEKIDGNSAIVTAEIEVYDFYKANKDAEEYYNNNKSEFEEKTETTAKTIEESTDENTERARENIEDAAENAKDAADNALDKAKDTAEDIAEGTKDAADTLTSDAKYINYRLDKLKGTKDRVKYTIDFTLSKKNGKWVMDDIDDITRQKIHGLYEH